MLSYWEKKFLKQKWDLVIIGSGFTGMSLAYHSLQRNKKLKILMCEAQNFGKLASTKNAGFACFGSVSELVTDVNTIGIEKTVELMSMRLKGINAWQKLFGSKLEIQSKGGYEMFFDEEEFEKARTNLKELLEYKEIKQLKFEIIHQAFSKNFHPKAIHTPLEFGINPQQLVNSLKKLLMSYDNVHFLEGTYINRSENKIEAIVNQIKVVFEADKIAYTNNALFKEKNILKPARAQVLITEELNSVPEGTFHAKEGYYYWRNVDNRLLLGGARHLDSKTEETSELALNQKLQNHLEKHMLPKILDKPVCVEQRWSGIMAMNKDKFPEIGKLDSNTFYAVKLGGMGVALSYEIGKLLAEKIWN